MERLDVQLRDFDDEETYAKFLREFVVSVRNHPFTDDDGVENDVQYTLNAWLKTAQLMSDRYRAPMAERYSQAVERALLDHDAGRKAEQTLDDIQEGRYA